MHKLLTICTAAYNASPYISKMLDSILASKYKEILEIIVVNDGSSDNTESIVNDYVQDNHSIVILVNKENGGSGSARNVAFELATGKYIKLIDADDWIDTDEFDLYIEELRKLNVDMVVNGHKKFLCKNSKTISENPYAEMAVAKVYDMVNDSFPLPKDMEMHGVTYKTEIIKNNYIKLSEGMPYVDLEYLTLPIPYIRSFCYINHSFYIYQMGLPGQSVNPEVVIKKGEKLEVMSKRLLQYYMDNLSCLSDNSNHFMKILVAKACVAYMHVYFLQEKFKFRKKIIEIDKEVMSYNNEIWRELPKMSGSLKLSRKWNYCGYYIMVILHKLNKIMNGWEK